MKKIIFFVKAAFCKRDYNRLGVGKLQDAGFDVEVWEFTPFVRPNVFRNVTPPDPIDFKGHRLFMTLEEAVDAIEGLDRDVFIVSILKFVRETYPLFRAMNRNRLKYGAIAGKGLPVPEPRKPFLAELVKKVKRMSPHKLFRYLCFAPWFPSELLGIRSAAMIISYGGLVNGALPPMGPETELVWGHLLDYDLFMKARNKKTDKPVEPDRKMAVFLDANVYTASDSFHTSGKIYVTNEVYFPELRAFFDRFEREFDAEVVIAAHPRAHYPENTNLYGGRKIIPGKTIDLVRDSDFVITHQSTSVSFAVLFRKPTLFITTDQYEKSDMGLYIHEIASALDKRVVNISDGTEGGLERKMAVGEKAYAHFQNDFIKKAGSPDIPFWDIFANKIKQM